MTASPLMRGTLEELQQPSRPTSHTTRALTSNSQRRSCPWTSANWPSTSHRESCLHLGVAGKHRLKLLSTRKLLEPHGLRMGSGERGRERGTEVSSSLVSFARAAAGSDILLAPNGQHSAMLPQLAPSSGLLEHLTGDAGTKRLKRKGVVIKGEGRYLNPAEPLNNQGIYKTLSSFLP